MMDNKFLSDIAKFGNSAFNAVGGAQSQMKKMAQEQVENLVDRLDLVSRKDLEIYKEIATKALLKVEELEKRIASLEGTK